MSKSLMRWINGALFGCTLCLGLALTGTNSPLHAQDPWPLYSGCQGTIDMTSSCYPGMTSSWGPDWLACKTSGTWCCEYTGNTLYCTYGDNTFVQGYRETFNGEFDNTTCQGSGVCL